MEPDPELPEHRPGEHPAAIRDAWHRERPDVDVSSIGIITPLWRLGAAVMANRAEVLARHDLDQPALDVLGTLRRAGAPYRLAAGELARRCRVTAGATTQRVARLEDQGYVRRVREEPDRRTVHVELTSAGQGRLDEVLAAVMAGDERMLAGLDAGQRALLEQLLQAWLDLVDSPSGGDMRAASMAGTNVPAVGWRPERHDIRAATAWQDEPRRRRVGP